jgi:hypothetical protein
MRTKKTLSINYRRIPTYQFLFVPPLKERFALPWCVGWIENKDVIAHPEFFHPQKRMEVGDRRWRPTFFRPLCSLCFLMLPQLLVLVLVVGLVVGISGLARRVGIVVPFTFIATYALGVGALTLLNIGALDMGDPKFREEWLKAWLEIYWPLWTVFFAPSALCALLATWFSGATERRDAVTTPGLRA